MFGSPAITLLCSCFSIVLLIASCKKEDEDPVIPPPQEEEPVSYEQYGTPFDAIPATEDIVMYEVNLRAFSSTGDIQGVIDHLDHIESLGVNVLWLMPIYPIGEVNSVNSPYSIKDFKAVNSEFGSLTDLRNLSNAAHARGMALMLDWVANHTAWDNAWIENTDWYTQDAQGNIIHPPGTNWLDVADLNYDNEEMRAAMIDAMLYWAYEANVDGFRCDHADGVPYDFWQDAIHSLDTVSGREFIFFAEGDRLDHFDAGFQLNFGWHYYGSLVQVYQGQSVDMLHEAHAHEYDGLAADRHWIRFTTNHDESAWDATPIELFDGIDGALAASAVCLYTGGVPLLYSSQEVGTAETVPFFYNSTIDLDANPDMLDTYHEMFALYNQHPVARIGENTIFPHDDVVCIRKEYQGQELLLIANVRGQQVNFPVPSELEGGVWQDGLTQETLSLNGSLTLDPYRFYVLMP